MLCICLYDVDLVCSFELFLLFGFDGEKVYGCEKHRSSCRCCDGGSRSHQTSHGRSSGFQPPRALLLPPLCLHVLSFFIFVFVLASVFAAVQVEPPPSLGGRHSSLVACATVPAFGCGMSLKLRSHGSSCARVGEGSSTRLQNIDPNPARPND